MTWQPIGTLLKAFNLSVFVDSEVLVAGVVPVCYVTASPIWIINDPIFVFTPVLQRNLQ